MLFVWIIRFFANAKILSVSGAAADGGGGADDDEREVETMKQEAMTKSEKSCKVKST